MMVLNLTAHKGGILQIWPESSNQRMDRGSSIMKVGAKYEVFIHPNIAMVLT